MSSLAQRKVVCFEAQVFTAAVMQCCSSPLHHNARHAGLHSFPRTLIRHMQNAVEIVQLMQSS
jgi:hypothetical protein